MKCFEERKLNHRREPCHGPRCHHRQSRRHHRRHASDEDALCSRLEQPFVPGKYKVHLLSEMETAEGAAWRQLWTERRDKLAGCCNQVAEKKRACMRGVREERWDHVCGLEEPLPHWHFSGQERDEVMDTCCETMGEKPPWETIGLVIYFERHAS